MNAFPEANFENSSDQDDVSTRRSTFFRHFSLKLRRGGRKSTYMYRLAWDNDPSIPRFTYIKENFEN